MKNRSRAAAAVLVGACLFLSHGSSVYSQTPQGPNIEQKGGGVANHAIGTFEVKLSPQPAGEGDGFGRMTIDKQFHGDFEGTSKGEMLTAMTEVQGSAGYVAVERVTGKLKGHSGTFVLQHNGTMSRGTPQLTITVVPDSGTGQLAGLTGKMSIQIESGKHSYDFEYTLPDNP